MLNNKKRNLKVGDDITSEAREHYRKMGYGSLANGLESATFIGDPFGDGVPRCVTVWSKK